MDLGPSGRKPEPGGTLGAGAITVCLITRDEEDSLGRCLTSIAAHVDEIVVVDTGSSDRTVDVARGFGARVSQIVWESDFSRARNTSLDLAGGEWVLVLDADEEVPPETAERLRALAGENSVEGWTFTIRSPVVIGGERLTSRNLNLRMFRNRSCYRFEGRVHEQVRPSLLRADAGADASANTSVPDGAIRYSGLSILHHGYRRDEGGVATKSRRNADLLGLVLAENPGDHFSRFNLATSLMNLGQPAEAAAHFRQALSGMGDQALPGLYRNYSLCLQALGEYDQAVDLCDAGLSIYPDYPDLYFIKGQVCWELGFLAEAEAFFQKCTHFRRVPPEYTTMEEVITSMAWENLAEVRARQGRLEEALQALGRTWDAVGGSAPEVVPGTGGAREGGDRRMPGGRVLARACGFMRATGSDEATMRRCLRDLFGLGEAEAGAVLAAVSVGDGPAAAGRPAGVADRRGEAPAEASALVRAAAPVEALARLATRCQELGLRLLSLEPENTELRRLVFATATLRAKATNLATRRRAE